MLVDEILKDQTKISIENVKKILDEGIDINYTNETGLTMLRQASMAGKLDVVRYLIENGADQDISDNVLHMTPIDIARRNSYEEIIGYLDNAKESSRRHF